jgi:tRNA (adenine37-N6)-methyltransferase
VPQPSSLPLFPIGVIRTPFGEKMMAPRQAVLAREVPGTLVLDPRGAPEKGGYEHALSDLDGWEYLWVLYWFHENAGDWRPKVLPPRSDKRRGVFSTRSPHRPNPIGLSVVRLEGIEGLSVHVRGVDMLDGSPLLDIKPYLAYADALPGARGGWLAAEGESLGSPPDPKAAFQVVWSERATTEAAWLNGEHGVDLVSKVEATLALGPLPHPYRRIKQDGDAMRLAIKDWRVRFRAEGRRIEVLSIHSGYRASQLADENAAALAPHRGLVAKFGVD